jgi:hypothetical protein
MRGNERQRVLSIYVDIPLKSQVKTVPMVAFYGITNEPATPPTNEPSKLRRKRKTSYMGQYPTVHKRDMRAL